MSRRSIDTTSRLGVVRMLTRGILECIEREKTILGSSEEGLKRLEKISPHFNKLKGTAIVGCISFVESEVSDIKPVPYPVKSVPKYSGHPRIRNLDFWRHQFDRNGTRWYGWDEFVNFYRIRHCFAHNKGILLKGHDQHLIDFREKLEKGLVKDRYGRQVDPYYNISSQNEIILENDAFNRLRILCMEFLILTGVEPPVTPNTGEVISF